MITEKPSQFLGELVTCRKCGDQIRSRFSGEFVTCKCGAISVDQTPYYSRYLGELEDFIFDNSSM